MNICVFLSAADLDRRYSDAARGLGALIAGRGHTLVWGGSDVGLMKVLADAVHDAGGRMIGVSVRFLADKARAVLSPDEMVVTAAITLVGADGKVLFSGSRSQSADYTTGPQVIANNQAATDAQARAAHLLADTIRLSVLGALAK